jgi:tripartite-type tricarboxylate transporter receptor subunit TctC
MNKILSMPEVAGRLAELGFYTEGPSTPEETRKFVQAQYELWGKVTRDIGLQPE